MATRKARDKAWNNARQVRGKDPARYRRDPNGVVIYRHSYGKSSEMGWELDHIKPRSHGGSDSTRNLQAFSTRLNRQKGARLTKASRHSKRNK